MRGGNVSKQGARVGGTDPGVKRLGGHVRKSRLNLYAPFIVLVLVQAAFVAFAPSRGETNDPLANLRTTGGEFGSSTPGFEGGDGEGFDPVTGEPFADGADLGGGVDGAAGGDGGATSGPGAGGGDGGGGGAGAGGEQAAGGDTSHCKGDRQTDLIATAPPCAPKFAGNNGGATYPGVTGTEIKFTLFECQPNEQVNAILATQGLAASQQESDAMVQATVDWMNATYEFYGRKLVWKRTIGDCTLTPPDPAKSRQAASEVAKEQPAFVLHYAGGSTTHDVWAQNGIVSLGGPTQANQFFAGRRPFRWDVFPNGTETADWIAEYACKKLAGKSASHAGRIIHPTIGGRDTPRKFGILTFDNGTGETRPNGERAKALIEKCSGSQVPLLFYESDINRAEEQTRAIVAKLIEQKITTVICMCDAIAPVFLTNGLTRNNYFPEHVLSGAYLTDYDILGRLYDPAQWAHAFGPSQLTNPVPFDQSDAAKIWRAAGRSGKPCASCNLITGYLTMIGSMIHNAGPNLNPVSIEQALVGRKLQFGGWEASGGNPSTYLLKFGPEDYNAISDFREVYWDATARSDIDGKNGAYIPMNGGRRYSSGQLDGKFDVPAKAQ